MAPREPLEDADQQQHAERDGEQQHGERRRALDVAELSRWPKIATEATCVLSGMLPLISTTEPNSPTALAKARLQPLAIAGHERRQDHAPERHEGRGPERRGRLLGLAVELAQHGLHAAHDERQRHERERDDDGRARVGDVDADRAALSVERDQREAGDDRRQREGQVDDAR